MATITMWQTDVKLYQLYYRRLQRFKLVGDDERIRDVRQEMDRHFFEMCLDRLDRAHWELEQVGWV